MRTRIRIIAFAAVLLLAASGGLAVYLAANRPTPAAPLDPQSASAAEVRQTIQRLHLLENTIFCIPETKPDVLAEVMVNSPDYKITDFDKKVIEYTYGKQGPPDTGLLTARQAYFHWRNNPPSSTPPPGLRPTQPPSRYCPPGWEARVDGQLNYRSFSQGEDGRIIVDYNYSGGGYEAILRQIGGKWMLTSQRIIRPNRG